MNETVIRLRCNGAAIVPGGLLLLGYAGNRGNYRLRLDARDEWEGLRLYAHWHVPSGQGTSSVVNGTLNVPAEVTAVPGMGCVTFEGTDGVRIVTSADVRCKICANSDMVNRPSQVWSGETLPDPTPDSETLTARLGLAVLGQMTLGRS